MTNEAMIWLSGLTIAVVMLAGVVGWMLWHYTSGMEASSAWLGVDWEANRIIPNEERQDDAWVAALDAQQEADASAGIEVIPVSETDTSPDNMIVSWTFKDAIQETPPRYLIPTVTIKDDEEKR